MEDGGILEEICYSIDKDVLIEDMSEEDRQSINELVEKTIGARELDTNYSGSGWKILCEE
jgi:hypothetical protein